MKIDKKELIRKIAEKHQVILTEDDPLIMMVTLNEVIFDFYGDALEQRILSNGIKFQEEFDRLLKSHEISIKGQIQFLVSEMEQIISRNIDYNKEVLLKVNRDKKNCALILLISLIFSLLFFGANLWLLIR